MSEQKSLQVWVERAKVGQLAQEAERRHIFNYTQDATEAVSLTMPVRLESWSSADLHPIFQMNLPEGDLLAAVRRAIAKIIGDDDLSVLLATGGNQIGRNRFSAATEATPSKNGEIESLDTLLNYPDTRDLFHELIKRYALRSGVSGVQPKVLLEANERGTLTSSSFIVKSWGDDFPQLAANEYFCMTAAKKAGLPVSKFYLADNGGLFVMKRFDKTAAGKSLGFEDMCSLQAMGTDQKYRGSYEKIANSLKAFISGEHLPAARRQFFTTLILSSLVQNGDAHLKNFGILYPSTGGAVTMAPTYDIVTTTVYIKNDIPALTLSGTKKWWPRKILEKFAVTHLSLTSSEIKKIIDKTMTAVMETRQQIPTHISNHPEFQEIGTAMMATWEAGVENLNREKVK
ncbi:MAG: type II toxin-antitoxin system HipA family toxin [Desulfuromusa sp.]|nr:type II toxin-antitoxin system HipA family toxin [Desulfuromusa sp.]